MDGLALSKDKEKLRPGQLVCFYESKHITVKDITVQNATCWCCYVYGCEYIAIHGIKIHNKSVYANTDGIDLDCSRFVTVSDCLIDTGDNAIAIRCNPKRLKNKERVCEYIAISNCVLGSSSSVFRIGVGTGKIRHMRVSDIVMTRGSVGINLSLSHGGHSDFEDIHFCNISATNLCYPLLFGGNDGSAKRITIENYYAEACAKTEICAENACVISDIRLQNLRFDIKDRYDPLTPQHIAERGSDVVRMKGVRRLTADSLVICIDENSKPSWQHILLQENCENVAITNAAL